MPPWCLRKGAHLTTARIVIQLDYTHDGPYSDVHPILLELHDLLLDFIASRPGLSIDVMGAGEAPLDSEEDCTAPRQEIT